MRHILNISNGIVIIEENKGRILYDNGVAEDVDFHDHKELFEKAKLLGEKVDFISQKVFKKQGRRKGFFQ